MKTAPAPASAFGSVSPLPGLKGAGVSEEAQTYIILRSLYLCHSEERSDEESQMLRLHYLPAQQDIPGILLRF